MHTPSSRTTLGSRTLARAQTSRASILAARSFIAACPHALPGGSAEIPMRFAAITTPPCSTRHTVPKDPRPISSFQLMSDALTSKLLKIPSSEANEAGVCVLIGCLGRIRICVVAVRVRTSSVDLSESVDRALKRPVSGAEVKNLDCRVLLAMRSLRSRRDRWRRTAQKNRMPKARIPPAMAMAVSCPLSSPLDDERWRFGEELANRVLWWTLMTGERSTLTPELDRREDADAAELRGVDIARSLVSRSSGVAEAMDTLIATLAAL